MVQQVITKKEVDHIILTIKEHLGIMQTNELADHFNISASAIGLWRHRGTIPNYIRRMYQEIQGPGISQPNLKGGSKVDYVIEVQQKTIQLQEEKIEYLNDRIKTLELKLNKLLAENKPPIT